MGKHKHRIIPAYHFKKEFIGDGEIKDYVNDILGTIEDDMQYAIENEMTRAKTELPTLFSVPGLSMDRARMHVYFHLLKALKSAGYTPQLVRSRKINGDLSVHIYVSWLSKKDTRNEKYMRDYIQHYSGGSGSSKSKDFGRDSDRNAKKKSRRKNH